MTNCRLRALAGALCVAITATAGAGRSIASAPVDNPPVVQDLKGTLTGTGHITINDNVAQNGASVMNGSIVTTGPDGDASIDLGALGRLQLRPNTSLRLALAPNHCVLEMIKCGSLTQVVPDGVSSQIMLNPAKLVQVATFRGEARVHSGSTGKAVKAGGRRSIYNTSEVSADGNATFTVNCCQCCFVEQRSRENH